MCVSVVNVNDELRRYSLVGVKLSKMNLNEKLNKLRFVQTCPAHTFKKYYILLRSKGSSAVSL